MRSLNSPPQLQFHPSLSVRGTGLHCTNRVPLALAVGLVKATSQSWRSQKCCALVKCGKDTDSQNCLAVSTGRFPHLVGLFYRFLLLLFQNDLGHFWFQPILTGFCCILARKTPAMPLPVCVMIGQDVKDAHLLSSFRVNTWVPPLSDPAQS